MKAENILHLIREGNDTMANTPEEFKSELLQMIIDTKAELAAAGLNAKQTCSDCGQDPCICAHASVGEG